MQVNRKDVASGVFFIAVGVLYGGIAWHSLPMGSALEMGPGYFPIVLSGILVVLGVVIAGCALFAEKGSKTPFGLVPWRGLIMLSLATIVFAAFIEELGLLPGVFVTMFFASLSSKGSSVVRSIVISLSIALFCTVIFGYGIRLTLPIIGPFFGG